jgi:hypothetical protein
MLHYDYNWDLSHLGIKLDPELDVSKLDWKMGDYFCMVKHGNDTYLLKTDPLVKFLRDGVKDE